MHVATSELRLVPLIELDPGEGVVGVDPFTPGSWLVPIDALGSPEPLQRVLQVHFADGVPANPDEIGPLCGGLALVEGSELLVLPTCCGDLGNLDNWRTAAELRTDSPQMLWIGHPWLTVWYQAPALHIREETEHDRPAPPREFAMAPEALQGAVRRAARELDLFCERVVASLRNIPGVLDPHATGRILVGRRDF